MLAKADAVSIIDLSPRRQGIRGGKDGFVTIMTPANSDEGVHTPASSVAIYIENHTKAREIAKLFMDFADELEKNSRI